MSGVVALIGVYMVVAFWSAGMPPVVSGVAFVLLGVNGLLE